ncbi:uncharacterized protein LTR77_006486 [Saxophila tyrrhenica]|uniref:Uncharacterized protein n=1 Tax=Saxophila tyrrhenica TaxID=1690608 RepID=A0AAV9PB53_9PEZI|nr:hypothetical protein LTR77_006486 [Saxophila tyrrhenica]
MTTNNQAAPSFHTSLCQYILWRKQNPFQAPIHVSPDIRRLQPNAPSELLKLPPEMRHEIYEYLVDTEPSGNAQLGAFAMRRSIMDEERVLAVTTTTSGWNLKITLDGVHHEGLPQFDNIRCLEFLVNVEGSRTAVEQLRGLNQVLRSTFDDVRTSKVQRVELTINTATDLTFSHQHLREYLSPAIAVALSVPQSTFSLTEPWPDLMQSRFMPSWQFDPIDPAAMRRLIPARQEVQKESKLFNKVQAMLDPKHHLKKLPHVAGVFNTQWLESPAGYSVARLKSAAALQRCVDRATARLVEREEKDFDKVIREIEGKVKGLARLRAARRARHGEQQQV